MGAWEEPLYIIYPGIEKKTFLGVVPPIVNMKACLLYPSHPYQEYLYKDS
jgi:hypothetical protein